MTTWREYQQQAAQFFCMLGLQASTDERVAGVRVQHNVDVVVRNTRAGIQQLWVIECKHWRRSVTKLHVAALATIVQDVGADRGILLSETGFQAGAIRLAKCSNITLTNLADLRANANEERIELALRSARNRLKHIRMNWLLLQLALQIIYPNERPEIFEAGPLIWSTIGAVTEAMLGELPTSYPVPLAGSWSFGHKFTYDADELLTAIEDLIDRLEFELDCHLPFAYPSLWDLPACGPVPAACS
jgi:restriction system protein